MLAQQPVHLRPEFGDIRLAAAQADDFEPVVLTLRPVGTEVRRGEVNELQRVVLCGRYHLVGIDADTDDLQVDLLAVRRIDLGHLGLSRREGEPVEGVTHLQVLRPGHRPVDEHLVGSPRVRAPATDDVRLVDRVAVPVVGSGEVIGRVRIHLERTEHHRGDAARPLDLRERLELVVELRDLGVLRAPGGDVEILGVALGPEPLERGAGAAGTGCRGEHHGARQADRERDAEP